MPTLTSQSQAVVGAFGQTPGVTPDHVRNLQQVLLGSPALTDQFNAAVAQGHLRQIVPLNNPHAGGEYDGQNKAVRLPLVPLTTKPGTGSFSVGEVTFVLGHELRHGFNHAAKTKAHQNFHEEAKEVARSPSAIHDYTQATGKLIAANRDDEASAEIAGWNAIISAVKRTNPHPTMDDIYREAPGRIGDFIEFDPSRTKLSLRPNLSLNPDLTLSPTPGNIEAMGQNYFDKAPGKSKLGHHGNSDYANYYGAFAMSSAVQAERSQPPPRRGVDPPMITLDMNALRLSEKLMEENGIDLGRRTQPMPYHDRSTVPASLHHFDHTTTTHTHVPIMAREHGLPEAPVHSHATPTQPYNAGFRYVPRTATDDFLDAYIAAGQRGDSAQCAALSQQHRLQPDMQALQQQGREMHLAEQERRLQEELRRLEEQRQAELERQQRMEAQQQHYVRGHSR